MWESEGEEINAGTWMPAMLYGGYNWHSRISAGVLIKYLSISIHLPSIDHIYMYLSISIHLPSTWILLIKTKSIGYLLDSISLMNDSKH